MKDNTEQTIEFFEADIEYQLDRLDDIRLWLTNLVIEENCGIEKIEYIFCSDEYLLGINKQYLEHDYYTDIITFPYNEGEVIIGDLFVSLDRAKENAIENKETFSRELSRLVIHGFLHLCGFNDKSPEEIKVMRLKEEEYLKLFGFT